MARADASGARNEAEQLRLQAKQAEKREDMAMSEAASARDDARAARLEADKAAAMSSDLQAQIDELNARPTDRGLVVTLGDVLFETGMSGLRGGTIANLDRLADFLLRYDTRTAVIEGHTDSVGSESSNVDLSRRRAESVQTYLVGRGVGIARLNASGRGEGSPVGSNDSETGRQQNRRVEVIVSNPEA
jgi:outer membrane protein OmpA-like peptidoglycan-associated protein